MYRVNKAVLTEPGRKTRRLHATEGRQTERERERAA
jgi:hypothetical protein